MRPLARDTAAPCNMSLLTDPLLTFWMRGQLLLYCSCLLLGRTAACSLGCVPAHWSGFSNDAHHGLPLESGSDANRVTFAPVMVVSVGGSSRSVAIARVAPGLDCSDPCLAAPIGTRWPL